MPPDQEKNEIRMQAGKISCIPEDKSRMAGCRQEKYHASRMLETERQGANWNRQRKYHASREIKTHRQGADGKSVGLE